MNLPVTKQIEFLRWQIKELELDFESYLNKRMNNHFRDKTAYKGTLWGVDESRGNLIVQFPKKMSPRLNNPYCLFLYKGIKEDENLENWNFSYAVFRESYAVLNYDVLPLYYLTSDDANYNYVGFRDVDLEFVMKAKQWKKEGRDISVVIAQKDPPYQYLLNLINFIKQNSQDDILNISIDKSIQDWRPKQFDNQDKINVQIINDLETSDEFIIQGPPGTGKSTLIAEIANYYLSKGLNVCITALTNKALMEVAEKHAILKNVNLGKVYKTNLSSNEAKKLVKLKSATALTVGKGELLLATYYKLSDWYNDQRPNILAPVYDLIIIEEASQCFLATIAAFKKLGKKVLIVGDPYQLPPVILNLNSASKIHPNILSFGYGLATYVSNINVESYSLTTTYRLSAEAASLTGIFYDNSLKSANNGISKINISPELASVIPQSGNTIIKFMEIKAEGDKPKNAIEYITNVVVKIKNANPLLEIAILAPFKKTILGLQESLGSKLNNQDGITIETIDRIQGLTVDYCIFLIPLTNPSFALNLNRFNVATSRSKGGTLIITDKEYVQFRSIHPLVTNYLSQLERI